jgi:UDP-glucose 4-epimerase
VNVCVTGGAGFIGSHLVEELLRRGHSVVVVDNLSTGRIENVAHLKDHKRFVLHVDTIANEALLRTCVAGSDLVFHLAASVGVRLVVENPVETIRTNVYGTELLLDICNAERKKVLVASTSEVYGKGAQIPFTEDADLVLGPTTVGRWSYACSKATGEYLALAYHSEKGLPVILVRIFNTIGPRQRGEYGMVVPRFVKQALSEHPITVYGDGSQTRCFCDVRDTVKGLLLLAESPDAWGNVVNLGTDREISIAALAEMVRRLAGSSSPITYVPYEEIYGSAFEDMRTRVPGLGKIRSMVGYEPRHSLEETLITVIDHFRG